MAAASGLLGSPEKGPLLPRLRFRPVRLGTVILSKMLLVAV